MKGQAFSIDCPCSHNWLIIREDRGKKNDLMMLSQISRKTNFPKIQIRSQNILTHTHRVKPERVNKNQNCKPNFCVQLSPIILKTEVSCILYTWGEEQDLLEILDLNLFGVKTLVSILIEPSLAIVFLLDSCLVWRKKLTILLDSCLKRNRYRQSCLFLAWRYFDNWTLD